MLDLHVHLIGERDRPATKDNIRAYLDQAVRKGLKEIGFADHDLYWEDLRLELFKEVAPEYPELAVRVGLEVDYRLQDESKIRALLNSFPFDFVIGSVHEIEGRAFDLPGEEKIHRDKDADTLYREYFTLVAQAARSKLFTTIGHFDLIKIFGVRPHTDILILAAEALTAVRENDCALEINTNGRYKPIGEFYPEKRLVEEIQRRGIAITLGSDAHQPEVVGRDLDEVVEELKLAGVKEIVGFKGRKQALYLLG